MTTTDSQALNLVVGNYASLILREIDSLGEQVPLREDIEAFARNLFLGKLEISHLPLARHQQESELGPIDLRDAKNCALILAEIVIPNNPKRPETIEHVRNLFNRGLLPLHSLTRAPSILDRIATATKLSQEKVGEIAAQVEQMDQVLRTLTIPDLFRDYRQVKAAHLTPRTNRAVSQKTKSPESEQTPPAPIPQRNKSPKKVSPEKLEAKRIEREKRRAQRQLAEQVAIETAHQDLIALRPHLVELRQTARQQFETNRIALGLEGENFFHRFLSTPISYCQESEPKFHSKLLSLAELEKNCRYLDFLNEIVDKYIDEQYWDPKKIESLHQIFFQHYEVTKEILDLYDLGVDFVPMANKVIQAENRLGASGTIRNIEKEWRNVLSAPFTKRAEEFTAPPTNCEWSRERINGYLLGVPMVALEALSSQDHHWIGELIEKIADRPNTVAQYNNPVDSAGQYWLIQCSSNRILVQGGSEKKIKLSVPTSVLRRHHGLSPGDKSQLTKCLDLVFRS